MSDDKVLKATGPKKPVSVQELFSFIAENPDAKIKLTGSLSAGSLPPFVRSTSGKRASILKIISNADGSKASEIAVKCRGLGASNRGFTDILALINGGYSPSSKNFGNGFITLDKS
tara:strand:- start:537 stop:884 length:348 start_codon:yes stop_codon:yes gene_type:complete